MLRLLQVSCTSFVRWSKFSKYNPCEYVDVHLPHSMKIHDLQLVIINQ